MTIIEIFSISFKQNYSFWNKPPKCGDEIWNIVLKGLENNIENRPNAKQLKEELDPIFKRYQKASEEKEERKLDSFSKEYTYVEKESK